MLKVIELEYPENDSFSWTNGRYAILSTTKREYELLKLDSELKPLTYEDGSLRITMTSIHNPYVFMSALNIDFSPKEKTKELQFEDVTWNLIDADKVSLDKSEIFIWEKRIGESNNKILHTVKIPKSLSAAIQKHVYDTMIGH
ncbi:MAG: hypothetical protein WC979_02305 [Candidatus Pacearchaeota archaeon]|jgi:hypothetical protein|nr:hypothetical protein [Clostridia bacterium]